MATKPPTIAQIVSEHIEELRALTDHTALKEWAEAHDLMTQARFPRFKKHWRPTESTSPACGPQPLRPAATPRPTRSRCTRTRKRAS